MTDKLPVLGTSAAATTFCAAQILGPNGTWLWIDGNQKITRDNGTYEAPTPNAFSLEAQAVADAEAPGEARNHCPGSTETCRKSCYVHGLEKHAHDTYELYRHNSREIRKILADNELANQWAAIMAAWITEHAAGGFRWHVSGDVFSAAYAWWIADVCRESPTVDHWIYTRSFGASIISPLADVSIIRGGNLALNLSCDKDNYDRAYATAFGYGGLDDYGNVTPQRLCYLTAEGEVPKDLPPGAVVFPDYSMRDKGAGSPWFDGLEPAHKKMVCPVDLRGKSDVRRCGPCDRCLG